MEFISNYVVSGICIALLCAFVWIAVKADGRKGKKGKKDKKGRG